MRFLVRVVFFLMLVGVLCGCASALTSTSTYIEIAATDNIQNLTQLYDALVVQKANETLVQQSYLNQTSPGVWEAKRAIFTKNIMYLNNSDVTYLKIHDCSVNYDNLKGRVEIDNVTLVSWDFVNDVKKPGNIMIYNKSVTNSEFYSFSTVNFGFSTDVTYAGGDPLVSHQRYENNYFEDLRYGVAIEGLENITVNNITIRDGYSNTGDGFDKIYANNSTFSNIIVDNVSDQSLSMSNTYGFALIGNYNTVHDVFIDGVSWGATNIHGDYNNYYNMTVDHCGHNNFEIQTNHSTFENITSSNATLYNFYQVGKYEDGETRGNNTLRNITSINPGTVGIDISEGSFDTLLENVVCVGKGIHIDSSKNITVINYTQSGSTGTGAGYDTTIQVGGYAYNEYHKLIDATMDVPGDDPEINIDRGLDISIINTNYSGEVVKTGQTRTVYYYPNLVVKNTAGQPIKNAAISVNTTAKDGYGITKSSFATDASGKLYDSGDRTNWLAVPDTTRNGSTVTSYTPELTATKGELTDSEIVNPDSTWYSSNLASLAGPEIVLTLEVPIPTAAFSANATTGTAPCEIAFTDSSTNSPTNWYWDFNNDGVTDSTEQNPVWEYDTAGTYTVSLTVSSDDGYDSEVKSDYITLNFGSSLPNTVAQIYYWIMSFKWW